MVPTHQRRGRQPLRIVFVTQAQRDAEAKIAKIKSVLGIETQEQFAAAAIKILSLAANFAEKHGANQVILGVKRNMVRVFPDKAKNPGA